MKGNKELLSLPVEPRVVALMPTDSFTQRRTPPSGSRPPGGVHTEAVKHTAGRRHITEEEEEEEEEEQEEEELSDSPSLCRSSILSLLHLHPAHGRRVILLSSRRFETTAASRRELRTDGPAAHRLAGAPLNGVASEAEQPGRRAAGPRGSDWRPRAPSSPSAPEGNVQELCTRHCETARGHRPGATGPRRPARGDRPEATGPRPPARSALEASAAAMEACPLLSCRIVSSPLLLWR
ncbi:hypothetical protein EYF80_054484 [Liparis tanakae]|uniref:Uncharacterized protein n=1 Tax=Liparis tanakae TaxID=230148 RepID=A0A4Z2F4D8_9TELE|nr:hypothetical protein EYF80_054484 [Liparis tanakae]